MFLLNKRLMKVIKTAVINPILKNPLKKIRNNKTKVRGQTTKMSLKMAMRVAGAPPKSKIPIPTWPSSFVLP